MKQFSKRLTYANVMSTIAVFLALAGASAFAASKIGSDQLRANSVKTGKIVREAVTTAKIKAAAVNTAKLADGAVTGAKVDEATLGQVPRAALADRATDADRAKTATTADEAKVAGVGYGSNSEDNLAFPIVANADLAVRSVALPAGSYVLSAYVNVNNNAGTPKTVRCALLLGGTKLADSGLVRLDANTNLDAQVLSVSGAGTLATAGTAEYVCKTESNDGLYLNRGLAAVQVAWLSG